MMGRLCVIMAIAALFVFLLSCQSLKQERSQDLVVVEQTDTIRGTTEGWAAFAVDVPVNGPKSLVDSVIALINRELYDACEIGTHFEDGVVTFSQEDMFTDDSEQVFGHYVEKYRPIIRDSLSGSYGIKLKLEAQTPKYVTYGLESFSCGASCGSAKYYYTFDKGDGHQVKDIISHESLVRFFEDYFEYATNEEYGWKFSPDKEKPDLHFGLLGDHFSFTIVGWYNHYFSIEVPYSQIFSYLSPEVQELLKQKKENEPMLPAYLSEKTKGMSMEVDTVNNALIGCLYVAGGEFRDTLLHYDPALELYSKRVYLIDAPGGSDVFLLMYSFGHLLYQDEAMTCVVGEEEQGLQPIRLFSVEGQRDSVVSCMWYDQPLEASDGFPFDEFDENRFGLHYDRFSRRLYYPILENHDSDSEFANTSCLRYTGRFEVLQFNGKEFVLADDDGAWWLNKDFRNYKRTISNCRTAEGIEQIDLMPDSTFRRAIWKGAQTLDDLRKKPDEVKISTVMDF